MKWRTAAMWDEKTQSIELDNRGDPKNKRQIKDVILQHTKNQLEEHDLSESWFMVEVDDADL